MQFKFSFIHMESSPALQDYARAKLDEKVKRFATKPTSSDVSFAVDKRRHTVRISVSGGDGLSCEVEYSSPDMYGSVDRAVEKLEAQLRRQKEKLKRHKGAPKYGHLVAYEGGRQAGTELPIDAEDLLRYESKRRHMMSTIR